MLTLAPADSRRLVNDADVNCTPWSVLNTSGQPWLNASSNASRQKPYLVTASPPKKPCRKEFSAQLVGRSVPTLVSWNLRHALDAVSATAKSANS